MKIFFFVGFFSAFLVVTSILDLRSIRTSRDSGKKEVEIACVLAVISKMVVLSAILAFVTIV